MEGRGYAWHITSDKHAYLEGPEPHILAAVLNAEAGSAEEGRIGWRVMSGEYVSLNYLATDIIGMEQMIRAVNVRLMNELQERKKLLEEDIDNVRCMIFKGEEDPYEY